MSKNANTTFAAHVAAVEAGAVTATNIIGIRKTLNAGERIQEGYSVSRTTPEAAYDWQVQNDLLGLIVKVKPEVTDSALEASGLAILRSKRHAKRLAAYVDIFGEGAFDHFALVGFDAVPMGRLPQYFPVYRCFNKGGAYFDFRTVPWQSGGNGPEIVWGF